MASSWLWFSICLADVIITSVIMSQQGKYFFYFDNEKKKFSMLGLEFAAGRCYIYWVLSRIKLLPGNLNQTVYKKLRAQLYTDFLFMPGAYIGIAIFCLIAAGIPGMPAAQLLTVLAYMQPIAWACDIIENIYLFRQVKKPVLPGALLFAGYRLLEVLKWGLSGGAFLLAAALFIYYIFIN